MNRTKCILIAATLISLLASTPASALILSGGAFRAEALPGEHLSHDLKVSLSPAEGSSSNLTVDILDWYQSTNALNVGMEENRDIEPYSARKFLTVSPKNFTLGPGASQQIKIEGEMPSGDGGRYAMIFVHTVPGGAKGTHGVAISFGIYSQVLLTISGSKLMTTGEIENLSLEEPISPEEQNVTMIFKNTGNYHYKINATASLKDSDGRILAESSPYIRGSIIPTARRMIQFSLRPESALMPGHYTVDGEVMLTNGTVLSTRSIGFWAG